MYFDLSPFPASTYVLVWYSQYLTRYLKAHSSIVSYLSGVKTLHTLLGYSIHGFHGFLLKLTLRGLRRDNTHVVVRARPMTPSILRKIFYNLDHSNPIHAIFGEYAFWGSYYCSGKVTWFLTLLQVLMDITNLHTEIVSLTQKIKD